MAAVSSAMRARGVFSLLLVVLFASFTLGMKEKFRIKLGNAAKCYSAEVHEGALVIGSYQVVSSPHDYAKISARLASPLGDELHTDEDVMEGSFGFSAQEEGEYHLCLWALHLHHGQEPLVVDLMLQHTPKEVDFSTVARQDHTESLAGEMSALDELMVSTIQEMEEFTHGIEELHTKRRKTVSMVGWLGAVTILVSTSLTAAQFWYLKTFFQRKKIL